MKRPPRRRSSLAGAKPPGPSKDDKQCVVCGRRIAWRAKWARHWDEVKYCSKGCRSRGLDGIDQRLEDAILELLGQRPRGASICPSEAARAVDAEDWRPLMERTRRAARRLVAAERLQIRQRGQVVDPSTARGPIRLVLVDRVDRSS